MRVRTLLARRAASRPWRAVLLALALALATPGCTTPGIVVRQPTKLSLQAEEVYARAARQFDAAIFHKPREGALEGIEAELAPLIMWEVSNDADPHGRPILSEGKGGGRIRAAQVGMDDRRVLVASRTVKHDNTEHQQVLYVWRAGATRISLQMTIGNDGFPVTYLVNADRSNGRGADQSVTLFVSRSLENRATAAFRGPLPGRRYAVQRSMADAPDAVVAGIVVAGIVVAGIVEDGPIPMGPYVYVAAAEQRVTTLLCRCSPSQVDRITDTDYYELEWGLASDLDSAWLPHTSTTGLQNEPTQFIEASLLRWPPE